MLDWVFFSPFLTARFSRHVFCYLFYYSCTSYPAHRATFLFCVECFTRKLTFLSIKLSERVVLNDKSRRRGREFQMNGRRVSWLVATTNHFTVSSLASLPAPCVTTGIRLLRTFPPMGWNWMSAPRFYVFRVKRKFLDVGCWSNAFNSWTIFFYPLVICMRLLLRVMLEAGHWNRHAGEGSLNCCTTLAHLQDTLWKAAGQLMMHWHGDKRSASKLDVDSCGRLISIIFCVVLKVSHLFLKTHQPPTS